MSTPKVMPKLPKALIGPVVMTVPPSCLGLPGVSAIYRISCQPIRRHYIGQTTDAARRWLEHQEQLIKGRHKNPGLQQAYNTMGPIAFVFEVLEVLPSRYDENLFCLAEARWFNLHRELNRNQNCLFNVRPPGTDNWLKNTKAGRIAGQAGGRVEKKNRNTFR